MEYLWWIPSVCVPGWLLIGLFPGARSFGVTAATFAGWRIGDALARDPHFMFDFAAGMMMLTVFVLGGFGAWELGTRLRARKNVIRDYPRWSAWLTFTLMALAFVACREIGAWHDAIKVVTTTTLQAGLVSVAYAAMNFPSLRRELRQKTLLAEIDEDLRSMRAESSQHPPPAA